MFAMASEDSRGWSAPPRLIECENPVAAFDKKGEKLGFRASNIHWSPQTVIPYIDPTATSLEVGGKHDCTPENPVN
jgi:hypothetical protein